MASAPTEWWLDHHNLADLWDWLQERGTTEYMDPARFMAEPWQWEEEYQEMSRALIAGGGVF